MVWNINKLNFVDKRIVTNSIKTMDINIWKYEDEIFILNINKWNEDEIFILSLYNYGIYQKKEYQKKNRMWIKLIISKSLYGNTIYHKNFCWVGRVEV